MTATEIGGAIVFFLTISGALWGIWWRIESKVKAVQDAATVQTQAAAAKADLVSGHLTEFRIHVAENYTTKQGFAEFRDDIMNAIRDVKSSVDQVGARVDRVIETQAKPVRGSGLS